MTVVCGMLVASFAMAAAHPPHAGSDPAAHDCVMTHDVDKQTDKHEPAKRLHCMGACSAVEANVPRVPARIASRLAMAQNPILSSLNDTLLERATPPPRLL